MAHLLFFWTTSRNIAAAYFLLRHSLTCAADNHHGWALILYEEARPGRQGQCTRLDAIIFFPGDGASTRASLDPSVGRTWGQALDYPHRIFEADRPEEHFRVFGPSWLVYRSRGKSSISFVSLIFGLSLSSFLVPPLSSKSCLHSCMYPS
jgi:hypothetical protein